MKVRQIIKLRGWISGSGWSYEQDYDNRVVEVVDPTKMAWDWWEMSEENPPSEDDTLIVVKFYAVDADVDEDEPLATHKAWASEIWAEKYK